jgi:hypothetical protein
MGAFMEASGIDLRTSRQIAVMRVLCIFFMMSVHVNPGFDAAAHSGAMRIVGLLEVDVLGRASVAALSLVSGFLLAFTIERRNLRTLLTSRAQTLYLPMAVWNAIFLSLSFAAFAFWGVRTTAYAAAQGLDGLEILVQRVLFLHGAPASTALGFLRDLAISSALLALAMRVPRLDLRWLLPVLLVGALFDAFEPVVYRPNILLFMTFGALLWRSRGQLEFPARWRPVVLAALALICLETVHPVLGLNGLEGPAREAANLFKRVILTCATLDLCLWLAGLEVGRRLARMGDDVYFAYLSHTTLISIGWVGWRNWMGDERSPAYVLFFIGAPLAVLAFARLARPVLEQLPPALQTILRGKVRGRALLRPHQAAAAASIRRARSSSARR